MKAFHSAYDLDRFPAFAAAARFVVGAAITASFAAAWVTAGPGNGYVAPDQWAAEYRSDTIRVALPQVSVVGRAGAQAVAGSVSCARGA